MTGGIASRRGAQLHGRHVPLFKHCASVSLLLALSEHPPPPPPPPPFTLYTVVPCLFCHSCFFYVSDPSNFDVYCILYAISLSLSWRSWNHRVCCCASGRCLHYLALSFRTQRLTSDHVTFFECPHSSRVMLLH